MAEEGRRFKTGYLAPSVSYAQMGKEMGEAIRLSLQDIYDRQEQRRARLNATYGLTSAMDEFVPAGVAAKYRNGGQILLNKMQDASAKAYQTQNQSDVNEYLALKNEFTQFKNIAAAKSALDNQTRNSIASGSYANLSGTIEENLQLYNKYNQADFVWDEVDQRLTVKVGDGYVPWQESNIASLDDVFVPQIKWAGTNYMPEKVGSAIYESKLSAKSDAYQVLDPTYKFATGELDEAAIYADVDEEIAALLSLRGPELLEAMQAVGWKTLHVPGKTELSIQDIQNAANYYNEEQLFGETVSYNGNSYTISSGSINEKGEWVFDIPDEAIKNLGGGAELMKKRKAVKVWAEQTARNARNKVEVVNQQSQIASAIQADELREEARKAAQAEAERAAADAAKEEPFATQVIPIAKEMTIPAHQKKNEQGQLVDVPERKTRYNIVPASVKGREFKFPISVNSPAVKTDEAVMGPTLEDQTGRMIMVKNTIHDSNGQLVGFDIAYGPGMIEGLPMQLEGADLKIERVWQFQDGFNDVLSGFLAVAQPKGRRTGRDLLYEAGMKINPTEFETQLLLDQYRQGN